MIKPNPIPNPCSDSMLLTLNQREQRHNVERHGLGKHHTHNKGGDLLYI
jgi:hypothetical protein